MTIATPTGSSRSAPSCRLPPRRTSGTRPATQIPRDGAHGSNATTSGGPGDRLQRVWDDNQQVYATPRKVWRQLRQRGPPAGNVARKAIARVDGGPPDASADQLGLRGGAGVRDIARVRGRCVGDHRGVGATAVRIVRLPSSTGTSWRPGPTLGKPAAIMGLGGAPTSRRPACGASSTPPSSSARRVRAVPHGKATSALAAARVERTTRSADFAPHGLAITSTITALVLDALASRPSTIPVTARAPPPKVHRRPRHAVTCRCATPSGWPTPASRCRSATSRDAYDNALAETIIGLFKTEVIRRRGPWRHIDAVEFATLAWVDWFNTRRLLEPIGYIPPAEYEERYYEQVTVT